MALVVITAVPAPARFTAEGPCPRRHHHGSTLLSATWFAARDPPVIRVRGGGTGRVSVAGLACYRPGDRSRLIYRLHSYRGRKGETKAFTWTEHRQLPGGNVLLVWDNLNVHLGAELRAFTGAQAWLRVFRLPAYAPDLNPVEGIWPVLKGGVLANLAVASFAHLVQVIRHGLKKIQYQPGLIEGRLAGTGLTLDRAEQPNGHHELRTFYLTCLARHGLGRLLLGRGLAHVVVGRFFEPGGRPGPGLPGFGAAVRAGSVRWMFRNPRRTWAGVSRPSRAGGCRGRRRSSARLRASHSWVWAAMMSQVRRSAAAGSRSFGRVQPRTCFRNRMGVLDVKPAQECLPVQVRLGGIRGGIGGP